VGATVGLSLHPPLVGERVGFLDGQDDGLYSTTNGVFALFDSRTVDAAIDVHITASIHGKTSALIVQRYLEKRVARIVACNKLCSKL
jgi:hypothetical protein